MPSSNPSVIWSVFPRAASASLILALCLVSGCMRNAPNSTEAPGAKASDSSQVKAVKVRSVRSVSLERLVPVVGSLVAREQALLAMKVSGRIHKFHVDLGSIVHTGDLIAEVEPLDYELKLRQSSATLSQARARLGLPPEGSDDRVDLDQTSTVKQATTKMEEATKNKKRIDELSRQGIISKSEVEIADANFEIAFGQHADALEEVRLRVALLAQRRVEHEIARQQLADTRIYAPFEGAVQDRRANLGEFLPSSAPVVTLVNTDPLRFRADIPERDAGLIHIGQKVRLTIEGDAAKYEGEIRRLSPSLGALNRMLVAEADVPNKQGRLRPGSFARGEILLPDASRGLIVPPLSVVAFAGIERVFVVAGGKISEKFISTGMRTKTQVEVVSGLKEGDLVAVEPTGLKQGQAASAVVE